MSDQSRRITMDMEPRDQTIITDDVRSMLLSAAELSFANRALSDEDVEAIIQMALDAANAIRKESPRGRAAYDAVVKRQILEWTRRRELASTQIVTAEPGT